MAETPMQGLAEWLHSQAIFNVHGHEQLKRWASEVEAARASLPAPLSDADTRWTIERAADFLEQYVGYIREVKPDDIERHPYLPEVDYVASQLRQWFSRPAEPTPDTALLRQCLEALQGVITWDTDRNYLVPYKVRDPVHAAIKAARQALEKP